MAAKELPPFKDLMSYLVRMICRCYVCPPRITVLHSSKVESSSDTLSATPWSPSSEVRSALLFTRSVLMPCIGTESTSIVMALACYFLTAEPHYFQLLRAELEREFPDPLGTLSLKALGTLPLLEGVINECLRLGLPFFLPRVAGEGGARLEGKYIPEGTIVALAAHSQQTSPENFFPDPLVRVIMRSCRQYACSRRLILPAQNFRPERWLPQGLGPQTKTNKALLATFSYGTSSSPDLPCFHRLDAPR